MARAPAKSVPMACVSIGHYDYLLPAANAIKIAELMQAAFECDRSYGEDGYEYNVRSTQPNVSFALVRPNRLRMPADETPSAPHKPRLLR